MKKNNFFIRLLAVCMIGCSVQTKQNKEQENIVKRDTAYVIEPFLRDEMCIRDRYCSWRLQGFH